MRSMSRSNNKRNDHTRADLRLSPLYFIFLFFLNILWLTNNHIVFNLIDIIQNISRLSVAFLINIKKCVFILFKFQNCLTYNNCYISNNKLRGRIGT